MQSHNDYRPLLNKELMIDTDMQGIRREQRLVSDTK